MNHGNYNVQRNQYNNGEKYIMDLSKRDIIHLLEQHTFNS